MRPNLARAVTVVAMVVAWAATAAARPDEAAVDPGSDGDRAAFAIPSVTTGFGSFAEVSEAIESDRRKVEALESRIGRLEQRPAAERLPAPDPPPAATTADEEPTRPYEIGTDKALGPTWVNGFHAESKHGDFRVKVGGRTQVDAVAFTAGPGPGNQAPNQGGLDPGLADTVDFRRARLRVEGRMYEFYDWAAEYDFVNQININNEVYPTERDSGPSTAVTDLWLQIRELPLLGVVRVGNQKDPYGYEHLTSSRWLNFMERSFAQDAFDQQQRRGRHRLAGGSVQERLQSLRLLELDRGQSDRRPARLAADL